MTFLEGLIRAYFHRNNTRVERLANGGWRASVDYSEHDIALAIHSRNAGGEMRELVSPLELKRRPRKRRLHWGCVRPRSGVLRLEQRGRFGQTLSPLGDSWVGNTLGAP